MRSAIAVSLAFIIAASAACVPSLNGIYTDQDVVIDDSIIGVWSEKDTTETWNFVCRDGNEYTLVQTDSNGKKGEFKARLVKIEDKTFLDLVPSKPGFTQSDFYKGHFLTTHTFVYFVRKEGTAQVSVLESNWIKEYIAANPKAIAHQKVNGEIVLTADTKAIQKFLVANLNTHGAFSEPSELNRRREGK